MREHVTWYAINVNSKIQTLQVIIFLIRINSEETSRFTSLFYTKCDKVDSKVADNKENEPTVYFYIA